MKVFFGFLLILGVSYNALAGRNDCMDVTNIDSGNHYELVGDAKFCLSYNKADKKEYESIQVSLLSFDDINGYVKVKRGSRKDKFYIPSGFQEYMLDGTGKKIKVHAWSDYLGDKSVNIISHEIQTASGGVGLILIFEFKKIKPLVDISSL